jgi:hypothetical protein
MDANDIVITCRGGNVVAVFAGRNDIRTILIDWDELDIKSGVTNCSAIYTNNRPADMDHETQEQYESALKGAQ